MEAGKGELVKKGNRLQPMTNVGLNRIFHKQSTVVEMNVGKLLRHIHIRFIIVVLVSRKRITQ